MSDYSREFHKSDSFMEPHSIEKVLGINTSTSGQLKMARYQQFEPEYEEQNENAFDPDDGELYVQTTYDQSQGASFNYGTRHRLEALVKEASKFRTRAAGMHGPLERIDNFEIE